MMLKKIASHTWVFENNNYAAEEALDRILDELSAQSFLSAETKIDKLLLDFPEFIDGWVHLAIIYQSTGRKREAYLANREAYRICLNVLPKKFNWNKDKLEWGFHENRPFLRACFNLALHMIVGKMKDEAVQILENLICVSPHENLGARYLLLKTYLLDQNIPAIEILFNKYPDDYSSEFYYGQILLALLQQDSEAAQDALKKARLEFPYILKELKKKKHTKPSTFDEGYIVAGGKEEAYVYWREFGTLWAIETTNYQFLIENS